jgi:TolA-binding protein
MSGSVPVAVAGGSALSRTFALGAVLVIVALIATVAYMGGRMQERGVVPVTPEASGPVPAPEIAAQTPVATTAAAPAPAAVTVSNAPTPTPVAGSAPATPVVATRVPAATAPAAVDDRGNPSAAAIAAELEDIRGTLAAKQYGQAIVALQSFIEQRPAHRLTPDAAMLLGEAYEASSRHEDAAAAYASVADRFKTSPRAPEALVRQAQRVMSSSRSQRESIARELYTRAAEEYPRSDWAPRALIARAALEERVKDRILDKAVGANVPMVLPTYRTIAERYPAQSEAPLWRMSEMFEDLDRHALQAQVLLDLVTRFPRTQHDAYWKLGEILERRLKDKPGAIDAYTRVPPTSPKYRNAQKKVQDLRRQ